MEGAGKDVTLGRSDLKATLDVNQCQPTSTAANVRLIALSRTVAGVTVRVALRRGLLLASLVLHPLAHALEHRRAAVQ